MRKLTLLVAGGIGYLLGAKAGRGRYEQIRETFGRVKDDPRVQEKAHQAAGFAAEKAPVVRDKVAEAAGLAADRLKPVSDATREDDATGLNPDRLKLGEDTGPHGDLP